MKSEDLKQTKTENEGNSRDNTSIPYANPPSSSLGHSRKCNELLTSFKKEGERMSKEEAL